MILRCALAVSKPSAIEAPTGLGTVEGCGDAAPGYVVGTTYTPGETVANVWGSCMLATYTAVAKPKWGSLPRGSKNQYSPTGYGFPSISIGTPKFAVSVVEMPLIASLPGSGVWQMSTLLG